MQRSASIDRDTVFVCQLHKQVTKALQVELGETFLRFSAPRNRKASKSQNREETFITNISHLLHLLLLLVQRCAFQLQQCGGNTHRQVVGIHLVALSVLQDVMEDAD